MDISNSRQGFEVLVEDRNTQNQFLVITKLLINAAGLNSVQFANLIHQKNIFEGELIKGEYYIYQGKERLEHLIYPIPSENSLGLHATIDLGKGIRFGPSAYAVEDIDYSLCQNQKRFFLDSIQSYWPEMKEEDLSPGYSGIRPKLKGIDDFVIDSGIVNNSQYVNILGYASPGLTSSLALGTEVSNRIELALS